MGLCHNPNCFHILITFPINGTYQELTKGSQMAEKTFAISAPSSHYKSDIFVQTLMEQWANRLLPLPTASSVIIHGAVKLCNPIGYRQEDAMTCKRFPLYWPFVMEIHRCLINSPHKGSVTRSFHIPLSLAWISCWRISWLADDLKLYPFLNVSVMAAIF